MWRTTSRERTKAEVTLKRNASSNDRSLVWSAGRGGKPPALFTRTSIRPNSASARATSASSCARSFTSQGTASARHPKPRTPAATASICSAVRAAQTTCAPTSAKASAIPRRCRARAGHERYPSVSRTCRGSSIALRARTVASGRWGGATAAAGDGGGGLAPPARRLRTERVRRPTRTAPSKVGASPPPPSAAATHPRRACVGVVASGSSGQGCFG